MEEAGGYAIGVLTLAACAVVIVGMLCAVMNESPLRKWRKLHTPPCRLCANHAAKRDPDFARARWDVCRCRRARERAESENEAPLASPLHNPPSQAPLASPLGSPHQNPDQTKPVQTSADQTIKKESASRFSPPSENEVRKYCEERGYGIDPATFVSYYASNGWMIGRSKIKDWKAAVRTWVQRNRGNETKEAENEAD